LFLLHVYSAATRNTKHFNFILPFSIAKCFQNNVWTSQDKPWLKASVLINFIMEENNPTNSADLKLYYVGALRVIIYAHTERVTLFISDS